MRIVNTAFDRIFFKDLQYIIHASIKLRWMVAGCLLVLPFFCPLMGLFIKPIPIIITALIILLYNTAFYYFCYIKHAIKKNDNPTIYRYKILGRIQILLDYITLVITLYFVGGLHTNLFYILIFHIVIGSIILSTSYMASMVLITTIAFYIISLLELKGIVPFHSLYNFPIIMTQKSIALDTLIHAGILFSAIFMIAILTRRIRRDNLDLTRTKKNLEDNLNAIKALELRKSKFMRYSAHQLRSPLATVISALNVLCNKLIPLDSDRAFNLLKGANDKAGALLEIVNDLLELSRIREGRKELSLVESVDPFSIIEEILAALIEDIEKMNLSIIRSYEINGIKYEYTKTEELRNLQAHLQNLPKGFIPSSNKAYLKDGFYNIIQNAVKYSRQGGKIWIRVTVDNIKNVRKFEIKDNGIGIDKDYIDDIFLEFVRSPNAKDIKNEGTGLGLPIAKEVFDSHGANIFVQSEKNKGSTFIVTFPL